MRHEVQAAGHGRLGEAAHRARGLSLGVERHERLARLAVLDELEAPEEAEAAHLADAGVLRGEARQLGRQHLAHRGRVLDDLLLAHRLDRRDSGGAGDRVAGRGEATGELVVLEPVGELLRDDHRAQRYGAGRDALGHGHDVGDDVPVLAGEPAACAPEADHDLVEDQQDAVAVADLADRPQVAVGRHEDAVRPRHRLHEDGGDGVRPLVLQDLLEVRAAGTDRTGARVRVRNGQALASRMRVSRRAAVWVRIEHPHDAGEAGLGGPAPRVTGRRHSARRRAVVGAVAGDDLVAPGVPARELDGVLDRLGAAVREQ